jgi:hypothetical protein
MATPSTRRAFMKPSAADLGLKDAGSSPWCSNLIISTARLDNMMLFLRGFRHLATLDTVGEALLADSTPDASAGAAPLWAGTIAL